MSTAMIEIDNVEFQNNQNEIAVLLTHAKNETSIILSKNLLSSGTYLEWNEQSNAVYEGITNIHADGNNVVIYLNEAGTKVIGHNKLQVKLSLHENDYLRFVEVIKTIFNHSFTLTVQSFIPIKTKSAVYANIKYLNLDGKNLTNPPEDLGKYVALEKLFIRDNPDLDLISTFTVLAKLPHLKQLQISIYGNIPPQLSYLIALESLHVEGDADFDTLPKDIGNLKSLNYFYLQSKKPIELPPQFSDLSALEFLHIRSSRWKLPEHFYKLTNIKLLDLYNCDITEFPTEMSQMRNLETIILGRNPNRNYSKLFATLGQIPALRTIEIDISTLPESIADCDQIEHLEIYGEDNLEQEFYIPTSFSSLKLKTLTFHQCNFGTLPDSIFDLTSLQQLHLTNCTFTEIPNHISKLEHLEEINIIDCLQFTTIHSAFSKLKSLRKIYFENVPALKSMPIELTELTDIEELYILDHQEIENVPNHWIKKMNS